MWKNSLRMSQPQLTNQYCLIIVIIVMNLDPKDQEVIQSAVLNFPEMVPVLIQFAFKHLKENKSYPISKLMVSPNMKVLQLQQVLRDRLKMDPSVALFLFCGSEVQCGQNKVKDVLRRRKNKIGILEITCTDFPAF